VVATISGVGTAHSQSSLSLNDHERFADRRDLLFQFDEGRLLFGAPSSDFVEHFD